MIFTYFEPGNPDAMLDNVAYAAQHARQTRPTSLHDLDLLQLFDWISSSVRPGRKGDAGYIVAGDCRRSRRADATGPAGFALVDLDDAPPDWAELDQYRGFAWTTASHQPDAPHWRVVIPFTEPVMHGALVCPFVGGHIRNRSQPAFLPTGAPEWRILEGTRLLDARALAKPKVEPKKRSVAATQLLANDEAIIQQLASVWKKGCSGDKAFGALGGWLRARGVSDARISSMALRLADVVESTHPDPMGRALDDSCPLGRPALCERLSIDADESQVVLLIDDVEALIGASTPGFVAAGTDQGPGDDKRCGLRVLTGNALWKKLPPPQWLCRELQLAPGRPPVIAAAQSAGKSWSLQCLAMAVALGRPVFGRFTVQTPGPVIHVCSDAGENATLRKYQWISAAMNGAQPTNLHVIPDRIAGTVDKFGVFRPESFRGLDALARELDARLVILDSMFAICAGIDMMAPEAGNALYRTKDDARVWLWTMHIPKAGGDYFGSAAIGAAAGVMWGITKDGEEDDAPRLWEVKKPSEDADGAGLRRFHTTWETAVDPDGARLSGQILFTEIDPPAPEETDIPIERIRADVIAHVRENGGGALRNIRAMVRGKNATIGDICKKLCEEGVFTYAAGRYLLKK